MLPLLQAAIVLTEHHENNGTGEKDVPDDVLAQSSRLWLPLCCCGKPRAKPVREINASILPMEA